MRFEYNSKVTNGVEYNDRYVITANYGKKSDIEGLIAHYRFGAGEGNTLYDSIGNNHGTINSGTWSSGGDGLGGLDFNGINDFVSLTSVPSFTQNDSWSIGAWIKTKSDGIIVSRYTSSSTSLNLQLRVNTTGKLYIYIRDNGGVGALGLEGNTIISDGEWHNVWYIRDASTNKFGAYLDGEIEIPMTADGTTGDFTNNIWNIGQINNNLYFEGLISDVRFWNYARTQQQIQDNMYGLIY